ncbi:hypothetical protein JXA85_00010 [Candidatus Woesearchaeota archaeon]|nr:hypothetical protein [Candidatus Woesearchaeota archaeon]
MPADSLDKKLDEIGKPSLFSSLAGLGLAAVGTYFLGPIYSSLYVNLGLASSFTGLVGYLSAAILPGFFLYDIPRQLSRGLKYGRTHSALKASEAKT